MGFRQSMRVMGKRWRNGLSASKFPWSAPQNKTLKWLFLCIQFNNMRCLRLLFLCRNAHGANACIGCCGKVARGSAVWAKVLFCLFFERFLRFSKPYLSLKCSDDRFLPFRYCGRVSEGRVGKGGDRARLMPLCFTLLFT